MESRTIQEQLETIHNRVKKVPGNADDQQQILNIDDYSLAFQYIQSMMADGQNLWKPIGKKDANSGVNEAGEEGGFYALSNNPDIRVFFKQDPVIAKNIGEFIASYVMRGLAIAIGFPKELIAQVELAYVDSNQAKPNISGDNVYVASVLYTDFLEIYKDAYFAFYFLPEYQELRNQHPDLANRRRPLPQKRPGLMENDPIIDLMIKSGRYQQINGLLQLSRSVDDPDVHYGNLGTIPHKDPKSEELDFKLIEVDAKGKMTEITDPNKEPEKGCKRYKIYAKIDSVRIDFGAAFGDDRLIKRSYNQDNINRNLLMTWITYHPSKSGPPPYFRKIPELVRKDPSALQWLNKIANVDRQTIERLFEEAISKVGEKYGIHPIGEFATLAGMEKEGRATNKQDLQDQVCEYMVACFRKFQENSHTYYQTRVQKFSLKQEENENEAQVVQNNGIFPALSPSQEEEAPSKRAHLVASVMEQLIRLDDDHILDMANPDLEEITHLINALVMLRQKLSNSERVENEPQSGISDAELFATADAIQLAINNYQMHTAKLVARADARQLLKQPDDRLICITSAMTNITSARPDNIPLYSLGSAEEHIATTGLVAAVKCIRDDARNKSFFDTIHKLLYSQVNRCLAENKKPEGNQPPDPQSEALKLTRTKAVNILTEVIRTQLEYEQELTTCLHKAIKSQLDEIEIMHRKNICILMRSLDNASDVAMYEKVIVDLIKERDRIQKCKELMLALNSLGDTNAKYVPMVNADVDEDDHDESKKAALADPLKHYGRVMHNEAGHLIAEMITKPDFKSQDYYDADILSQTLVEAGKAVVDPLSVNVKVLQANADELSGKPSRAKRIGGIAGLIVTVACSIALTLVVLGCFAAATPSGGASLLGIPAAVYLFGAATGISLVGSIATLFSARRKGVSKVTTRVANEVKERQDNEGKKEHQDAHDPEIRDDRRRSGERTTLNLSGEPN